VELLSNRYGGKQKRKALRISARYTRGKLRRSLENFRLAS
jgi:hypothetical protein